MIHRASHRGRRFSLLQSSSSQAKAAIRSSAGSNGSTFATTRDNPSDMLKWVEPDQSNAQHCSALAQQMIKAVRRIVLLCFPSGAGAVCRAPGRENRERTVGRAVCLAIAEPQMHSALELSMRGLQLARLPWHLTRGVCRPGMRRAKQQCRETSDRPQPNDINWVMLRLRTSLPSCFCNAMGLNVRPIMS